MLVNVGFNVGINWFGHLVGIHLLGADFNSESLG